MLKAISVMFIWARKQGSTTERIRRAGCARRRLWACGLSERRRVAKLLRYSQQHAPDVYPMIAAAIYTGMRKGELLGLRWIDVLFDRGLICVAHSYGKTPKSGKWRPVPLHPALGPILREWQRRSAPGSLVFPVVVERGRKSRMGTPDDMLGNRVAAALRAVTFPSAPGTRCVTPRQSLRHVRRQPARPAKILGHSKFEMTQITATPSPPTSWPGKWRGCRLTQYNRGGRFRHPSPASSGGLVCVGSFVARSSPGIRMALSVDDGEYVDGVSHFLIVDAVWEARNRGSSGALPWTRHSR